MGQFSFTWFLSKWKVKMYKVHSCQLLCSCSTDWIISKHYHSNLHIDLLTVSRPTGAPVLSMLLPLLTLHAFLFMLL